MVFLILPFIAACQVDMHSSEADTVKYSIERIINYNTPTEERYAQGMDIFEGNVFQAFSDGTIDIYDITTGAMIQTLSLPCEISGNRYHLNNIYIDSLHNEITLWIPSNKASSPLVGFSLYKDDYLYQVQERVKVPAPVFTDEERFIASTLYVGNSKYCIRAAYLRTGDDGYGDIQLSGFLFDDMTIDVSYLQKWERQYGRLWAMQGGCFKDNSFFLAVGVPSGDAKIYVVDLTNGELNCFIDFRGNQMLIPYGEEMQGITFYSDVLYFSTTYGLYKIIIDNKIG